MGADCSRRSWLASSRYPAAYTGFERRDPCDPTCSRFGQSASWRGRCAERSLFAGPAARRGAVFEKSAPRKTEKSRRGCRRTTRATQPGLLEQGVQLACIEHTTASSGIVFSPQQNRKRLPKITVAHASWRGQTNHALTAPIVATFATHRNTIYLRGFRDLVADKERLAAFFESCDTAAVERRVMTSGGTIELRPHMTEPFTSRWKG